jgi:RNA polymerase sigma-70 factor, ECF subfamily
VYHRDADGALRADGVVVLAATATGISRVTKFLDPALVVTFGQPWPSSWSARQAT